MSKSNSTGAVPGKVDKLAKWNRNWSDPEFNPPWKVKGVVEPVRKAVADGWWKPGADVLDIGCGAGEIAAWLAGQGFRVMGVDFSRTAIAAAQRGHAGAGRLTFKVADVSREDAVSARFDALVDRGCMHCLDQDRYEAYARNVARWSKPGAHFLLLIHYAEMSYDDRVQQIRALFGKAFQLQSHEKVSMEGPSARKPIPGIAFRMVRRPLRRPAGAKTPAGEPGIAKDVYGGVVEGQACAIPTGGKIRRLNMHMDEHPHWCYPLTEPQWVPAAKADFMRPDDPVLGLEFNGGAWAVPWFVIKNHHVANLTLKGTPVMVMFCELCSAAGAFDPIIDGKRHTFKLGGLFNGTGMPQDYETETIWAGFNGEALEGPLTGRIMERLPLLQCTWEEWCAMHPETLVVDGTNESRTGHGEGHSPGSPYVGPYMGQLLSHLDTRLPHYELVLGVLAGGKSRCYPLSLLAERGERAVNDTVGGEQIVVFARPGSWLASAFSRRLEDRLLDFSTRGTDIVDDQTGSMWDISGRCTGGALQGRQLRFVHSGVEEFFLWAAFNPETGIHGFDGPGAPIQQAVAILDAFPRPVQAALESKWFKRGARTLVIGDDDGMVAALLAEGGAEVTAINADGNTVGKARQRFRGVVRLRYEVADVCAGPVPGAPFDAVVDLGMIAGLPAAGRPAAVAGLATACRKNAHVLVLVPVPAGMLAQRRDNISRFFAPAFRLRDAEETTWRDPRSGKSTPSAAFRFIRT